MTILLKLKFKSCWVTKATKMMEKVMMMTEMILLMTMLKERMQVKEKTTTKMTQIPTF